MAIINKGKTFANGEQLTADKLNQVIDNATFTTSAVDNVSTQLAGEAIIVKDGGVTTAKIADANVTFAKLTDVIDDDTMATASATKLATSESIKAYVDASAQTFTPSTYTGGESVTLPNGLIMKWGVVTATINGTAVSFGSEFPTGVVAAYSCPNSAENLKVSTGYSGKSSVDSLTTTGMNVSCDGSAYWQAIGY